MADLLNDGIDFFNDGRFFQAHEAWEDLWRETGGEARSYYQGLVQVAVGLDHLTRENLAGGRRVLERGIRKLAGYSPDYSGIDNTRLIRDLERVRESAQVAGIRIRKLDAGGQPAGDASRKPV